MINHKISEHISYFEATHTNKKELLDVNRRAGKDYLAAMAYTAQYLIEPVRHYVLNDTWFETHSLFRSQLLNEETPGSSPRSQHPKGEAVDCSPWGRETRDQCIQFFLDIKRLFIERKIMFGQLIFEEADRGYSKAWWVHMSCGAPFRDITRCGQILTMKNGEYKFVERVNVQDWW